MSTTIEGFLPSWRHSRQLTLDFIDAVPDARWDWSLHPCYATLGGFETPPSWKVNWGL